MYPQITEYNEAVQNPQTAFVNPKLARGRVDTTGFGLPLALSGGFALTYSVRVDRDRHAVRCFHREVPTLEVRYGLISRALNRTPASYFVPFEFQPQGIRVRGQSYPIVRMDWVEGQSLGTFLENHSSDTTRITALRDSFRRMAEHLHQSGMAHGDIQNGNVIVTSDGLRLIDYDGMFVPQMSRGSGTETGHKHFQHPHRSVNDFGPEVDRFAFIVVEVSLSALIARPILHSKYNAGGETILFRANDFADPDHSPVFEELSKIKSVAESATKLARISRSSVNAVPTLSDFLAGINIPNGSSRVAFSGTEQSLTPATRPPYLSPYQVISATDYSTAALNVGNRVELIGQIHDVKTAFTKHRKPYVFVNFGPWRGNIVKLAIWSQALKEFHDNPNESWVGKYVSVTGLVDEPYTNRRYGYTHLSISVGGPAEIQFIGEHEARYRMGDPAELARISRADGVRRNRSVVDSIKSKPQHAQSKQPQNPANTSSLTRNKAIAASLRVHPPVSNIQSGLPSSHQLHPGASQGQKKRNVMRSVPFWITVMIALAAFRVCAG